VHSSFGEGALFSVQSRLAIATNLPGDSARHLLFHIISTNPVTIRKSGVSRSAAVAKSRWGWGRLGPRVRKTGKRNAIHFPAVLATQPQIGIWGWNLLQGIAASAEAANIWDFLIESLPATG
jgi:hypothetical protein